MKRVTLFLLLCAATLSLRAQSVEVRFLHGKPMDEKSYEKPVTTSDMKVVVRKYKLVKCDEGLRLVIPKEHIAADV